MEPDPRVAANAKRPLFVDTLLKAKECSSESSERDEGKTVMEECGEKNNSDSGSDDSGRSVSASSQPCEANGEVLAKLDDLPPRKHCHQSKSDSDDEEQKEDFEGSNHISSSFPHSHQAQMAGVGRASDSSTIDSPCEIDDNLPIAGDGSGVPPKIFCWQPLQTAVSKKIKCEITSEQANEVLDRRRPSRDDDEDVKVEGVRDDHNRLSETEIDHRTDSVLGSNVPDRIKMEQDHVAYSNSPSEIHHTHYVNSRMDDYDSDESFFSNKNRFTKVESHFMAGPDSRQNHRVEMAGHGQQHHEQSDTGVESSYTDNTNNPMGGKLHVCQICTKGFKGKSALVKHIRIHTGEKPHICRLCDKAFAQNSNLTTHMRTHSTEKPHLCSVCEKGFNTVNDLTQHMSVHTGEKPCKCLLCDKSFNTNYKLKIHMRSHTGERPYTCSVCEKAFTRPYDLKVHIRTHTGEKHHICSVCDKAFKRCYELTAHMRTHTGEKPYTCTTCFRSFAESGTLANHMRIHTGNMPYNCGVCNKDFYHSSNLKRHMRSHIGEKPFECTLCHKAFNTTSDLKRHMEIHTQQKRYTCSVCLKEFRRSDHLKKHTRTHAAEKNTDVATDEKYIESGKSGEGIICVGEKVTDRVNEVDRGDSISSGEPTSEGNNA